MAPPTTAASRHPGDPDRPDRPGHPGRSAGVRPWGRNAAVVAAGLALLAVTWLMSDTGTVAAWEVDVFGAVNDLPDILRWPLWPIMQLGTVPMYVVGGVGVYAVTRRTRPALATATAVLIAWLVARIVKDTVERGRPVELLDDVDLRQTNPDGYVSGHASVAFALATALTMVLPGRWRWVPLPVAALVGFARLFFGVHLPLDVLGGAGVGLVCGTVAVVAFGADATQEPETADVSRQPDGTAPQPDRTAAPPDGTAPEPDRTAAPPDGTAPQSDRTDAPGGP